jgi:hypothetical protein
MNATSIWFLVSIATSQYIGPIPAQECATAAAVLQNVGVHCRPAVAMTACAVDGRPGTYTSCPVFDFPQVTVKP